MKIRHGFVSNSSSSSFAVFGVLTNNKEIIEKLGIGEAKDRKVKCCNHKFDRDTCNFCPECGKEAWKVVEPDSIYELIESACTKKGLVYLDLNEEGFGIMVGTHVDGIKGSKGIDALSETNIKIQKIFGKEAQIYSGEYYN